MSQPSDWRSRFRHLLPLYGHRNWIVIADAAFPAQVGAMEIVATGEDHLTVVGEVLAAVDEAAHLRPVVWLDAELDSLTEELAPGWQVTRARLAVNLHGLDPTPVLHAELLERLHTVAQSFHVLVLKTTGTVPYSSVFLELDCGYWPADREAALRERMGQLG